MDPMVESDQEPGIGTVINLLMTLGTRIGIEPDGLELELRTAMECLMRFRVRTSIGYEVYIYSPLRTLKNTVGSKRQ